MCVIVHQPNGTNLTKERAERLWNINSDGGGFAFIDDDGKLRVKKYMTFPQYWREFETARSQNPRRDFLLHMRIKTHGPVSLDNVHPFVVDDHTVMAHNGIIHGVPDYGDGRSDTRVFVDEVLPSLPADWLDNRYLVEMVEEWIGWSKLMFLTNSPHLEKNVYLLNEHKGTKADGMWFSNSSGVFKHKMTSTTPSRTVYSGGGEWSRPVTTPQTGNVVPFPPREGSEDWERLNTQRQLPPGESFIWGMDDFDLHEEVKENKPQSFDLRTLQEMRKEKFLFKTMTYDPVHDEMDCLGCDETVDSKTGECGCHEKICLDCSNYAGWCKCARGFSLRLRHEEEASQELIDKAIDNLTNALI